MTSDRGVADEIPTRDPPVRGKRRELVRCAVLSVVLASAVVASWGAAAVPPARASDRARIGIFVFEETPEVVAAREGLLDGFRLSRLNPVLLERDAAGDEAEATAALRELTSEGVHVVVALGDAAAQRARDLVRDRPVVFTLVSDPDVLELRRRAHVCGVAAGLPAETLVRDLRRAVPSLQRLGVVVPVGDEVARAAARELATLLGVVEAELSGETPGARAAGAISILVPAAEAIWLPPGVSQEDAAALAAGLAGRGVALVGSRRRHLDAGCALTLHADPRTQGTMAAVIVREILEDADPSRVGTRRPSRRLMEVNLPASERLGFQLPLTLLAGADRVVPPLRVPK